MLVTTQAIVLSTVKYGDHDLIARLYTRELGSQSYMLKGVRKSRKGAIRSSHFQPLTHLEITTQHKGKGGLEYIKNLRLFYPYQSIPTDVIKSSIAMFFAEVLTQLLKEQPEDQDLFDFLIHAFQYLDTALKVSNFSIKVLLEMSAFMGFQIDRSNVAAPYFHLLDGTFDYNGMHANHATQEESEWIKTFLGTSFDAIEEIKLNREQRARLLHLVIDYFQVQLDVFKKPASLDILKQLFS